MLYIICFICFMQLVITCLIYRLIHEQARRWSIYLAHLVELEIKSVSGDTSLSARSKTRFIENLERI